MISQEERRPCEALTREGKPCKNYALSGSDYCHAHQPAAGGAEPQPAVNRGESQPTDEELRRQLAQQLDMLTERVQEMSPEYQPPAFSVKRLVAFVEELLSQYPRDTQLRILERLRETVDQGLFDIDTWKGIWFMLNYTVKYNADMVKRRFTGEYETDEWGLDWELLDAVRPFFTFLYKVYWRVETTGLENIPIEGRALLVSNHSGQLPWDGVMVGTAVLTEHPAQRLVRTLHATLLSTVPFVSSMLVRMGQTLATVENGIRLLEQDELVAVYPEGYKGIGKPYKDRYKLARFGRGGFVKMALTAQAPMIPVAVVGAEETNIALAKIPMPQNLTGVPYIPITASFPWFGLLGWLPMPTKWTIDFGTPISLESYGPQGADNLVLVSQLTDQVRNVVQDMLVDRLARRRSVFRG
ncbi:lysophospholipid acyltransferase family protein [Chloroflexota bacterium]